jgi:hypothetical protein
MEAMPDSTLLPGEIWEIGRGLEDFIVAKIRTTSTSKGGRIAKSSMSLGSKIITSYLIGGVALHGAPSRENNFVPAICADSPNSIGPT